MRLLLAALLLAAAPAAAAAQHLDIVLPPHGAAGDPPGVAPPPMPAPMVRGAGVLADAQLRDLVHNGFPARLHYRVELWSAEGLINDIKGTLDWSVVVRYDPLAKVYEVGEYAADNRLRRLGAFEQFGDAEQVAEQFFRIPLAPRSRGGRWYYNAVLDVETLSLGDLDEVERWLNGELRPAVRGERNPGTAIGRGLRTLFVRLLGGERRHYEQRSGTFAAP